MKSYLSKRENGTYSVISNECSVNQYTDKETCLKIADKMKIQLSVQIWDCANGKFITE